MPKRTRIRKVEYVIDYCCDKLKKQMQYHEDFELNQYENMHLTVHVRLHQGGILLLDYCPYCGGQIG